jgi:hypothetical protein
VREIRPGDLVCADADGVVVGPAAEAAGIVDVAERVERVEAAIVAAARRPHAARSPRAARASDTTPACEFARPALDGRTTGAITPAAVIGSALADACRTRRSTGRVDGQICHRGVSEGDLHVSHTATARRFLAEGEPVDAVGEQPEDQVSAATSPAAVALTVAAQL